MNSRSYKRVYVKEKGERSLLLYHPWVYEGEIVRSDLDISDGEIVDVLNSKDKYLGSGFYNHHSKIRIRIISFNSNDKFDEDFWRRRINYALSYREMVMPKENSFRLIYGEADEFPGLTVDKFNDILVCQILSLGIEIRKDIILPLIYQVMQEHNYEISGIYLRGDLELRNKEGLDNYTGWYENLPHPKETKTIIMENDIQYIVDFQEGQKTGFFLDQKKNRLLVRQFAKDRCVLDCCTHTGSFSMNAYLGGAKRVVALDISDKAINDAKENFKLNKMKIETITEDVFKYLEKLVQEKKREYDFIILDPPAFTKSRKTVDRALKGYEEINYLAMRLLPRGGLLATASCSHFATDELFLEAIRKASIKAKVRLKQIKYEVAAMDHPILIGVDETRYLKFYLFQVF